MTDGKDRNRSLKVVGVRKEYPTPTSPLVVLKAWLCAAGSVASRSAALRSTASGAAATGEKCNTAPIR